MARILPDRVEIYSMIKKSSWYLRQMPLERPKEKPEDTVIGIINALSRLTIAILGFPHIVMQSFAWLSLWPLREPSC